MIIKRKYLKDLMNIIAKGNDKIFDIQAQYKLIKLKKIIQPELEILNEQIESLSQLFDKDEMGNFIYSEDGGIKVKSNCIEECNRRLYEIEEMEITLPDIYFSLEELAPIGLTLREVEILDFCIK